MSSFNTTTVSEIIEDLNYTYLLPAIQREFVWDPEQMLDLFDSIVREYPIGSFLFWRVSGDYAEERVKYKFVRDYIEGPIYPDEIEEVSYHNKRYKDEYNDTPNKLNLVLDGQQRLSTLYIGLKGTLTVRGYNRRRDRVDSWTRKQLYLNALSSPDTKKNGRRYEFQFKEPNPDVTKDEYWYRVGDILSISEATQEANKIIEEVKQVEGIEVETVENLRGVVQRNIANLDMAINKREIIPYFSEKEEDQDKVLDIFIRTNEGGTQLSKSDVLLSVATAHWQSQEKGLVAREVIERFVDKLNAHPVRAGVTFSPNFVLRTLLTCSGENMTFTLDNFTDSTLSQMKSTWQNDKYKKSIIKTLDILDSFGFTTSHVQSKSTLLPVVYYIYENDIPSMSWESKYGRKNRSRILFWLASMVVTGEMNTGGTIQTIQSVREAIQSQPSSDFPLTEIEDVLQRYKKSMGFDEETVERWLGQGNNSLRKNMVFLSLLYYPSVADERNDYEIDHIFPKSEMTQNKLTDKYGYGIKEAKQVEDMSESVANLQLIQKSENREKSAALPNEWLETRTEAYFATHYIPEEEELYSIESAKDFFEAREKLIKEELVGKTPDRSALDAGPPEV